MSKVPVELPEHVREFVAGLNETDVDALRSLVRLFRDIQTLCRFARWIVYVALGGAFIMWQGVDGIRHLFGLVAPKAGP